MTPRRSFIRSLIVVAVAPTIFIPKFEPVTWCRGCKLCQFKVEFIDQPMIVDERLLDLAGWHCRINKAFGHTGRPENYIPELRDILYGKDGRPGFIERPDLFVVDTGLKV